METLKHWTIGQICVVGMDLDHYMTETITSI